MRTIRRAQVAAFMIAHIPLTAILAWAVADGVSENLNMILVAFFATVVSAVALVFLLSRLFRAWKSEPLRKHYDGKN